MSVALRAGNRALSCDFRDPVVFAILAVVARSILLRFTFLHHPPLIV